MRIHADPDIISTVFKNSLKIVYRQQCTGARARAGQNRLIWLDPDPAKRSEFGSTTLPGSVIQPVFSEVPIRSGVGGFTVVIK